MNTTEKGNAFEELVFCAISRELSNGGLGIDPTAGKVFQKKGYYSKDREKNIIVDISIEVWPKLAANYAFLWVCECKNYGHPVPVDDIEEFKAKLDQIAGKNVKGVVATTHSFQNGAQQYAKNQGIGLIRVLPNDQVSWLLNFTTTNTVGGDYLYSEEVNSALSDELYKSTGRNFYSIDDGFIFGSWRDLLARSFDRNLK